MQFAKLRYCCTLPRRMPKVRNVQLCCREAAKLNEEPLTAIAHLKAAVPEFPTNPPIRFPKLPDIQAETLPVDQANSALRGPR